MKINEFIANIPPEIISGENISISSNVFRKIFSFSQLAPNDIFYYLNFGNNYNALHIAKKEFNAKEVYGIHGRKEFLGNHDEGIQNPAINIINKKINEVDLSKATVILYWLTDINQSSDLVLKFEKELKRDARVVTLFSPLGMVLPSRVHFPFILSKHPFYYATNIREQIQTIYGKSCVDFTTSWMLAEKYVKEMEIENTYSRFTIILLSMILWINSWNLKVTCEEYIPPPVESYEGILRMFFNIDLKDMFVRRDTEKT